MGDLPAREAIHRKSIEITEEMENFLKAHNASQDLGNPVLLSFLIGRLASLEIKSQLVMEQMG